jgi:hypothetical protein
LIALWAVIPSMILMYIAGRTSKRKIFIVDDTEYNLHFDVSHKGRLIRVSKANSK